MQETTREREAFFSIPLNIDAAQGRVTRETYLAYLGQAYHHVKNTLPLLMLMGSRIPKEKEWIRRELVEYIAEETGHDDWILADIKNAGGDPEAVRNARPCLAVELMNAFNYDMITRQNPLGYFGMIVVLEGISVGLGTSVAQILQKSLGLGKECFTYFESHGDLDIEHTKFIANILNKITDAKDQEDIIHATKVIYQLDSDMLRSLPHNYAKQAA
jgi:pyrroloquinoline quinone (PQQ) biosynthesis protein C